MNNLYVDKKSTQLEIKIQDDPSKFSIYQWAFVSCKCHRTYVKFNFQFQIEALVFFAVSVKETSTSVQIISIS